MRDAQIGRYRRLLLLGGLASGVAGLLICAAVWFWRAANVEPGARRDLAPDDPRVSFPTAYRNVRPGVKYVGDEVCAACHAAHVESYRHHPMGQAMAPIGQASPIERLTPDAKTPFTASGLQYAVTREAGRTIHQERFPAAEGALFETHAEVMFSIGSGARARSYAVSRDGYLYQSPITWFTAPARWDLSPSYELRNLHFGRVIAPGCLFCHCNQVEHVPGTANRYRPPFIRGYNIGCERCHGPGELHAARHQSGDVPEDFDDTIVNPARLDVPLREAVCQQCHLQGEQRVVARGRGEFDYRPGLPLHLFLMDFVDARNRKGDHKFVSAVEQMMDSRCYAATAGDRKLGCTSCHDPHAVPRPENKVEYYRKRCLNCHQDQGCRLPLAARRARQPDDSCAACHLPRISSEVNHTSNTDHRIRRQPPKGEPGKQPVRTTPGPDDLVPFHDGLLTSRDAVEAERNLGMALIAMMDRGLPDVVARGFAAKALPLLSRAVQRHPGDLPARASRGDALWVAGRPQDAWKDIQEVLAAQPESERALHAAGNLAMELKRNDDARTYFERAVRINPWNKYYHHGLAVVSFRKGQLSRGVEECRRSLRLEPTYTPTRSLLIQCYLGLGERDKAKGEYETILATTPEERRGGLRRWYDDQVERLGR